VLATRRYAEFAEKLIMSQVAESTNLRRGASIPKRFIFVVFAFTCLLLSLVDRVNLSVVAPLLMKQYSWDPVTMGTVLGAFFWGFSISPLLGGWLADRLGGKKILGFGALWWSVWTMLTPLAPGVVGFTIFRTMLGLGEGVNAPAIQSLASRWFPVQERTRAVAFYLSGGHVGTIIAFPLTTWIVASMGWPAAFYIYGAVGFVWVVFWYVFGSSSPEQHSTISKTELRHIQEGRGASVERGRVPWRALLTRAPVWSLIFTTFSVAWMVWLFVAWLPTYLMETHKFSLRESGIYAALPFIANTAGQLGFGWVQDRFISKGVSITLVRKVSLTLSFAGAIVFLLLIPTAQNPMHAVWYLTGAMAVFSGAQMTVMVNNMDIGPRYAGVILGLQATAGNLAGAISPIVAGAILARTGSFDAVFYLIVALLVVSAIIWNLLATGEKVVD
jgi:MFS transporter, ACS family, solute carrier family 17 (sodium-dependent inorganic phosphate cotransporter), other